MNRTATPFLVIGGLGMLLGGLFSAISAASPSYLAAWAVAYLVLVVGVAQVVLGLGQARLAVKTPSEGFVSAEVLTYNLANIAVLGGSMFSLTLLTWIGAGLIVVAMGLFIWAARGAASEQRWWLYGYRAMIVIILVSAPIGIILANSRMG
ncbi:MAG: hypothetical protein ACTHWW_00790 [Arthrobacter sp.]|uniref:hypothetical protein n=1 Tax=unclassified Arthrobacter TaxID=235627 RepID=UPI00264CDC20|nr:hypothetical protein [Micrococcaceae bacterium]MDN5886980.1 hypothetical protein [Micrococcaceae bacterium]MDN6169309.1 hypothetical protein [Micrococcaceae bacterium]MDN6201279.1 hypothetical protein [Micrococcaceae bacterium]MDN6300255.1 hypothetical protein [Micrococcaceae bacterium]